jgi:hypothetical protein
MLAKVDRFEIVGRYLVRVAFTDGSSGTHDFAPMIANGRNLVAELQDQTLFDRLYLDFGALTWPNGFDISPEWLRREMIAAGELRSDVAAE